MDRAAVDVPTVFAAAMEWLRPLHDFARAAYYEPESPPEVDESLNGLAWASDVLASVVSFELGGATHPTSTSTWLIGAPVGTVPTPGSAESLALLRAVFVGVEGMLAQGDGNDFMGAARLLCGLKRQNLPHDPEWFGPETRRLWSLDPCRYTLGPGDFWPSG
ncbi:MAG: hypothetical protein QOJ79_2620 [Actinomycetota bacterium]|jgi:hypothetical protein|nr:hypothetical protein [Actinomycetota bacterium]